MKEKGFTLVELLGVIAIIGVLALLALPSVEKLIKEGKDDLYVVQINNIKSGLKNWATDNTNILPSEDMQQVSLTLGQLKLEGYVEMKIKNPKNNKCFGNDMILTITRNKKNYIYEVHDDTDTETDECSEYSGPYMILNGEAIMYVEVGDTFVDPGIVVKSIDGTDLSDLVTTKVTGIGSSVNTSTVGNEYTITYSVVYENATTSINRTVIINDTIKPELIIPGNITISKTATAFDVMEGVSATDNSGEVIDITSKSNISFGIPGNYTITYTATDSSGNNVTKNRILTISSGNSLKDIVVTNDFATSIDTCVTSGTCAVGTKFAIEVAPDNIQNFYVISDVDNKVTLIMDSNLGEAVRWGSTLSEGPISALEYLETQTSSWINIPANTYTLTDDSGVNIYTIIRTNARSRIISKTEVEVLLDENSWLYGNLTSSMGKMSSYWTSTPSSAPDETVWAVTDSGKLQRTVFVYALSVGVRPVIEVFK